MNPCHVTTICTHLLQVKCQDVLQNNEIIPTHTPATPTPPAADMGCVFYKNVIMYQYTYIQSFNLTHSTWLFDKIRYFIYLATDNRIHQ